MLKSKIFLTLLVAVALSGVLEAVAQTIPPATKEEENRLLSVLQSDAPYKDKATACRQLGVIGTKDAVPVLASLLGDEKLSHMARYALEPNPDPSVDAALRDALGKVEGGPLVGVIGSLGVRRDIKAVDALAKLLDGQDDVVIQAAARALGSIGNSEAAAALKEHALGVSAANQLALCEGLFRCAETLLREGGQRQAITTYDLLRSIEAPHQVRAGGVRGAILARDYNKGVRLLAQYLTNEDYILFSAAVQTAQELDGSRVTEALVGALDGLPADNQILILQTIGTRGDPDAVPAVAELAKQGDAEVRVAALDTLTQLADPAAVPVIVATLSDPYPEVAEAGEDALAAFPAQEADAAVMAMLGESDAAKRVAALGLMGRRRMTANVASVMKSTTDADEKVRVAALRLAGELGGPDQFDELLGVAVGLKSSQELDAAQRSLTALGTQADDKEAATAKVAATLSKADPAQQCALVGVLGAVKGANALKAVRAAVGNDNADVSASAVRALAAWNTTEVAPDLLALAKGAATPALKIAALRGYITLIRNEGFSVDQKLAMSKDATALIERTEERRLLLGVLGSVPSLEALNAVKAHLADEATQNEACMAAVAISEQIAEKHAGEVAEVLKEVLGVTKNAEVKKRAKTVLDKLGVSVG